MNIMHRLTDPSKCATDHKQLKKCQDKIESCMTRLFRQPRNGGNPFLFSFTAPYPHALVRQLGPIKIGTAATDGKMYYWNPDFLMTLTADEVQTVMAHEAWHVIFFHCHRMKGCLKQVSGIALDYVVNAVVEVDHERNNRPGKVWGGNIGKPVSLAEYLKFIDGDTELSKDRIVFTDKTLHGRSPESIYDEIMRHWDKSPRKCQDCHALSLDPKTKQSTISKPWGPEPHCPKCGAQPNPSETHANGQGGGSLDGHIDSSMTKQDVQGAIMKAARQTSMMKGIVPSEVEDLLGELIKPTLKFTDLVRSAMMRKIQDAGMKNDWKRFRKRYISASPRQYLPKRHTHKPRWIAMLDTSGSMRDDDIVYGLSQLQSLGNTSEGFIVPCDAEPKWANVTPVKSKKDIKRTKIVGRGGTVFDQFFKELPDKLGCDFDVCIVLTDGYCGEIPLELQPPMDVVWVVTRGDHKDFKPSFGRVAPLRINKL
jgi:predicted metal-dependent peptidase